MIPLLGKILREVFPADLRELSSFWNVCCNLSDEEAVQNTATFFGIWWPDISPERWRAKPSVMTFFTPQAFHYYLPSLINCSRHESSDTELSVVWLVQELAMSEDDPHTSWRDSRWAMLSKTQSDVVIDWLESLKLWGEPPPAHEIDAAIETLCKLKGTRGGDSG